MSSLEYVLSDYEDQYMDWLEDEDLLMGEGTAFLFLSELEEGMEMCEY